MAYPYPMPHYAYKAQCNACLGHDTAQDLGKTIACRLRQRPIALSRSGADTRDPKSRRVRSAAFCHSTQVLSLMAVFTSFLNCFQAASSSTKYLGQTLPLMS